MHCSYPHLEIDTIMVAAHLLINLQTLVSRQTDPLIPKAISVCQIHGGEHFAATPQTVVLRGAFLVITDDQRAFIEQEIEKKTKSTCEMFGAQYNISYQHGSPALVNNKKWPGMPEISFLRCLARIASRKYRPPLVGKISPNICKRSRGPFTSLAHATPKKGLFTLTTIPSMILTRLCWLL